MTVERVGVSFGPELLDKFDKLIDSIGYTNRSEAIRDIIREWIVSSELEREKGKGRVVGTITLLYDHDTGDVTNRLLHLQHGVQHSHVHPPHGKSLSSKGRGGRTTHADTHSHADSPEILATTHIHVDEHNCLEVLVVRGEGSLVRELTGNISAIKGVKYAEFVITKADV